MPQLTAALILLVDDEEEMRAELRVALEDEGHAVVEANDGQEALVLLTSGRIPEPHLIILDLNMPVMTGWEFLSIIEGYHRLSLIPVIAISGNVRQLNPLRGRVAACLAKPVTASRLLQEIQATVRGH
ncbi:MAG TPA: response regulator [Polyangiaceae bacterium]|jgi:CheY-like chemotaxis protein|nr:response regulator [Polyangiaceae bacterium]